MASEPKGGAPKGGPGGGSGEKDGMSLPAKVALTSALGIGMLITGYVATRQGRRLVRETFKGVKRTPLEFDVLEALDGDRWVAKRRLDVREVREGDVRLTGTVASEEERERAVQVASDVRGVVDVVDGLEVDEDRRARRG